MNTETKDDFTHISTHGHNRLMPVCRVVELLKSEKELRIIKQNSKFCSPGFVEVSRYERVVAQRDRHVKTINSLHSKLRRLREHLTSIIEE